MPPLSSGCLSVLLCLRLLNNKSPLYMHSVPLGASRQVVREHCCAAGAGRRRVHCVTTGSTTVASY